MAADKPHFVGHRQCLLRGSSESLPDYELLELLLFGAQPRRDVKPLAKRLIERFGSLAAEIAKVPGMGDAAVAALKTVQAATVRLTRQPIQKRTVITSWDQLLD